MPTLSKSGKVWPSDKELIHMLFQCVEELRKDLKKPLTAMPEKYQELTLEVRAYRARQKSFLTAKK